MGKGSACDHGVRWPHPCRECEDDPRVAALLAEFRGSPYLAVELMLMLADQKDRDAFPFVLNNAHAIRRLFALGLVNSHGWPTAKGRDAELLARPVADEWARGHKAGTFAEYLSQLPPRKGYQSS